MFAHNKSGIAYQDGTDSQRPSRWLSLLVDPFQMLVRPAMLPATNGEQVLWPGA
jgi:hypothetical protein